jgi:hypothetical protein
LDYKLIFKLHYSGSVLNARGHRPEIVYVDKYSEINIDLIYNEIIPKTFIYTRLEPVRFLDLSYEDINIRELFDDEYALANTIDKEKLIEYNKMLNGIRYSDENVTNFKKEYECKWVGDKYDNSRSN